VKPGATSVEALWHGLDVANRSRNEHPFSDAYGEGEAPLGTF
jgi:hypothetical protein